MSDPQTQFDQLRQHFRETSLVDAAAAALEWDERTGMPKGGGDFRAEQVAHLRGIVHSRNTSPQIATWLEKLTDWEAAADPHGDIGATLRLVAKDYQKNQKLPQRLVERVASATVRGQGVWDAARKADDYQMFQPAISKMVALQREVGQTIAEDGQTPYEALLNEYEPGAKVADLIDVFENLRNQLVSLIRQIQASPKQVDDRLLKAAYPIEKQRVLSHTLADAIGFDFNRGRLDETSHPFCTTLGPSDCRILTRYETHFVPTSIFGTLHEAGHGLYEQGLRDEWYGLPPGSYASLGIHESQSRLWENLIGRSRAFWQHFTPLMKSTFPTELAGVDVDQLHAIFNRVEPSLIRVEADEATYNLHIIVRFELEQALIAGELSTDDLPDAWSDRYAHVIGIRPPSHADGVLQDVHWSAGLFGYFPTYTLGNLVSAQLFEAADEALGGIDELTRRGEFEPLLEWLRSNIHRHGRNFSPDELVQKATGRALSACPLMDSLRSRYGSVYDLG